MQKAVRWPSSVCGACRGGGSDSIQCNSCKKWAYKKCSGIKGSMSTVMALFFVEVA